MDSFFTKTPRFSSRIYVRLAPSDVAMFRFLLEAEDNLARITTVDRWSCALLVAFSPHQADAVRERLAAIRETIRFDFVYDAATKGSALEPPQGLCPWNPQGG